MPSFQRLKHPFRRPTHYYAIHEPSPTPKQLERQRKRERKRALDKIENDLDDGRIGSRGSDSPVELPVIIDRGPYTGHIYPREQLFFNSIMLASDAEPIYAGLPGGELRQEVHRTPVRRPDTQGERKPPPRPVPSEYLTAAQNTENLRRWEERSGRTPAVRRAQVSERILSPPRQPSPPRGPITPGTREWDAFMDFPMDNYAYTDPGGVVDVDAFTPVRILSTTSMSAVPPHPIGASETTLDIVLQTDSSPLTFQSTSSQIRAQVHASTRLPGSASIGTEKSELLKWNPAINSTLHNKAVDPEIRARIRERVQRSSTTVGIGLGNTPPITMVDVDPVPNFSYPIARSEFHDRLHPGQAPRSQSLEGIIENEEQQQEQRLPNDVSLRHYSHLSPNDTVYRSPTPTNLPLRGGNEESRAQLTNGVPPGYYPPSLSSSDDSSDDPRHHPPSPPDRVPEHVFVLLRSLLTPSELVLHYNVIQDLAPPHPPPFPDPILPSNSTAITPVDVRLVRKLHTAIYGLQDRVIGVEEDLIPDLSTYLEQRHLQIRELDARNLSLQEEIAELKRIVDFSNKVLAGCWERECEVWRTLNDIQRRREKYRGPLACIFSRASNTSTQDNELLDFHRPESYVVQPQPQPFNRAAQGPLKKKELDALLLMAKQNVNILVEDLKEMRGLVDAFQGRNEVDEETLPAERS